MSSIYNSGTGSIYNESDEFMAGQITFCASGVIPAGWMECNGAAISRATYGTLFATIGTNYGAGDGVSTFNLPDLRGEFLRGADRGRGVDAARQVGSYQPEGFREHGHALMVVNNAAGVSTGSGMGFLGASESGLGRNGIGAMASLSEAVAQSGGAETRPRNVALIPIIKYS